MATTDDLNERLTYPDALLQRTDLYRLGCTRRAADVIFRELPVVVMPGFSRPMIRVGDFLDYLREHRYDEHRVRLGR